MLGLNDDEMAELFGVAVSTVRGWKADKHFKHNYDAGRIVADARTAVSMFKMANGFERKIKKIRWVKVSRITATGREVTQEPVEYEETVYYPPKFEAAAFVLLNRWGDKWTKNPQAPEANASVTVNLVDPSAQAAE